MPEEGKWMDPEVAAEFTRIDKSRWPETDKRNVEDGEKILEVITHSTSPNWLGRFDDIEPGDYAVTVSAKDLSRMRVSAPSISEKRVLVTPEIQAAVKERQGYLKAHPDEIRELAD